MAIKVSGKNLDLGESLREYAIDRIEQAIEKYFNRPVSGLMCVERSHGEFLSSCSFHLHSGVDIQSSGRAQDAYASVDDAAEKLEKRLRRYKRRLKKHHGQDQAAAREAMLFATDYVIKQDEEEEEGDGKMDDVELAPPIIAEGQTSIMKLSVGDAVMHMDLADRPFLIFRNAGHGGINVVYRRPDGNIGWIDPANSSSKKE